MQPALDHVSHQGIGREGKHERPSRDPSETAPGADERDHQQHGHRDPLQPEEGALQVAVHLLLGWRRYIEHFPLHPIRVIVQALILRVRSQT